MDFICKKKNKKVEGILSNFLKDKKKKKKQSLKINKHSDNPRKRDHQN